jgi:PPM family protein phosphatase
MKIERGYAQHVGSRNEQQDAGLVLTGDGQSEQLVLVADGMGGHAGGSIASAQVAETARRIWGEHRKTPIEPKRLLDRIIREGHEAINRAGAEKGLTPRSTCVLLYLRDGGAHWAHVGDSRIYRLRDGQVTRLTRDHSVVQMLVDLGKVSEDEMGNHPDQNRLTQSLGGDAVPMPDFGNDQVKPHDAFLVCSDGLWEMISQPEMAAVLAAKKLGDDGAKHLADRAFDRAKPKSDNITVALVRVDGPPPGSIGADADEARTTRLPETTRMPETTRKRAAGGGARWGFVAATVVALGAAAAVVYKPWNKDGLDVGPTPAIGPTERPADKGTPPQQEKRTEPPKSEVPKAEPPKTEIPKTEPGKPDGEPKPADRKEPPAQGPEATPPKDEKAPESTPPQTPPGDQGQTPPKSEPPASGGPQQKKQAAPRQAPPPRPAQPATPRQSGLGPDAKPDEKKGTEPPANTDKPGNSEKQPETQPQGPGQPPETKPQ